MRLPHPRPNLLAALLTWSFAALLACSSSPEAELRQFAPDLTPEAAAILVADDSSFTRYASEVGSVTLQRMLTQLIGQHGVDSYEDYLRARPVVMPRSLRVAEALREFHLQELPYQNLKVWEGFDDERGWEVFRLAREFSIFAHELLPAPVKMLPTQEFLKDFQRYGLPLYEMVALVELANLHRDSGDVVMQRAYYDSALVIAQRVGPSAMECQLWGEFGAYHSEQGRPDSMWVCYGRALDLARRSGLADHVGRALSFYARAHAQNGHLATANEFYHAAIEECRELKGGTSEIRFLLALADFNSELGCWRVVDRLVQQAELKLREGDGTGAIGRGAYDSWLGRHRANSLYTRGRIDEAHALFLHHESDEENARRPWLRATRREKWGQRLLEAGRTEQAMKVLRDGHRIAHELHRIRIAARISLHRAEAHLMQDQLAESAAALHDFEDEIAQSARPLSQDWVDYGGLALELGRRQSDPGLAIGALRAALGAVDPILAPSQLGIRSYLALNGFARLRDEIHELVRDEPSLGLRFELCWRALVADAVRGRGGRALASVDSLGAGTEDPVALVRAWVESREFEDRTELVQHWRDDPRELRLLYVVRKHDVLRWSAGAGVLRREALSLSRQELVSLVERAIDGLSRVAVAQAEIEPELYAILEQLAPVLLPETVGRPPDGIPTLLILADGFLTQLPFGVLPMPGVSANRPVLERWDIAYQRIIRNPQPLADGPATVFAGPALSERVRRRHPGLAQLSGAQVEVESLEGLLSRPKLLVGAAATEEALRDSWEASPLLYLASHVVRDPETPYITYVPTATGPETTPLEQRQLEFDEILAGDLSGCGLVVLSACASGAPYVERTAIAPSLADAFVDAGAATAVQTFWGVDDAAARDLMRDFLRALGEHEGDVIRALNAARREWMGRDDLRAHPFYWASYSVQVSAADGSASVASLLSPR